MTASESKSTTDNPTLTAEEIGKRFLKLIEGLESLRLFNNGTTLATISLLIQ